MRYEVWGDMMPAVTLSLEAGESIYTQSGGMSWMTDQIEMTTNMKGGLMKGFGRCLLYTSDAAYIYSKGAGTTDHTGKFGAGSDQDV